jgi:hypothetical protein
MSDEGAPKSAYEIAMARLRAKDKEAGVEERPVSEKQRARVAEVRSMYDAKLAERQILHESAMRKTGGDAAAIEALEEQYQRDRERISGERDRKIEAARSSD